MDGNKIIRLEFPEKCRIIAVSDIHTQYGLLKTLLKRAGYRAGEDFLVIIGDYIGRGMDAAAALEYVKGLRDESGRVICLKGNNDTSAPRMAYTYTHERFAEKFNGEGATNCFVQMAASLGFTFCSEKNIDEMRRAVIGRYGDLLEFLRDLPVCLVTEEYVFVHAGLENRPDWENTDETFAITVPWFLRKENPTGRWLVTGHFPTYNYRRSRCTCLPIIDAKKKMIGIDGGLTIKSASQINMLIIHKDGKHFSYEVMWEPAGRKAVVTEDFSSGLEPVYVSVDIKDVKGTQDIEILSEANGIARLRDNISGNEGWLPVSRIYYINGRPCIYDFLSSFPSVKKGESVSCFSESGKLVNVITESGIVGWIPKKIIAPC